MARSSLLRVAASRVGTWRAYRVIAFMVEWQIARESLGVETLTLQEWAAWWRVNERTAYREQARFREAFPEEATPDRLMDAALASWNARDGVEGLAKVQLPRLAA